MSDLAATLPEAPDADWAATQIGRYNFRRLLGTGGMGVVVAAHDPELDREVAIKLVVSDEAVQPIKEAQAMAKLSHPNVVQVYEVIRLGDRTGIVMELVEGQELGTWQKDQPWREIIRAYAQACRGLAAAHRANIVHRDFKPSNALVDKDGIVRVTDFGLAHATKDTPLDSAGTPAYMAPEQHRRGSIDARTDQWSLACALYEALYGYRPFTASTTSELAPKVLRGDIAPEPASSPVPRKVRAAIRRALSTNPDDRFASIEGFATAITQPPHTVRYVLAGGALVLVALVTALVMSRGDDAVCDDLDAPMRTLWTADARAALRARLLAPTLGLTESAVDNALQGLDAFAASWVDTRVTACTDTQRGVRSADTLDGRMRCLDRRHAELSGLLDALGAGGPDALRRTNDAIVQLRPPAACADAIDDTRPTSPAVQADLDAGENLLARASAAMSVWQFERASGLVAQALTAAELAKSPSLISRALLVRGEAQDRLGRSDDALATYQRAAQVAARAREPAGVAQAMSSAFLVEGDHIGRRADALRNRPFIELAVDLAGQPEALRASWLHHLAIILYEDPAEVEEAARSEIESLAIRRRILPASHPYIYDSMETLANVEIERKNFDHAHQLLLQVLEARKASRGARALSAVYTNLGVLEGRRGKLLEALEFLQQAYDISISNGKQNLHALFNIAGLHLNLGRARLAARTFEQCFEVYQRRHKQSRDVADSLAFAGISSILAGEPEKGRSLLARGIEMGRTQGSPTHSVNLTYAAQLALGDRDRSRARALLEEATKPSIANPALHGLVSAELARDEAGCAAARPLFDQALARSIADSERWVQTLATLDLAACELDAGAVAAARARLEPELAWLVRVGADDSVRARVQTLLAKAK